MKRKKQLYMQPTMDVVRLNAGAPLLDGSNNGSSGGTIGEYETINEGEPGGWTNN